MFQKKDAPKAVWTAVHATTVNGQKYNFYLSEGGAFKVMLETVRGEQLLVSLPCKVLPDLSAVADQFETLHTAFKSIEGDIVAKKAAKAEAARIETEKQRALAKAVSQIEANKQSTDMLLARIESLTGKKVS